MCVTLLTLVAATNIVGVYKADIDTVISKGTKKKPQAGLITTKTLELKTGGSGMLTDELNYYGMSDDFMSLNGTKTKTPFTYTTTGDTITMTFNAWTVQNAAIDGDELIWNNVTYKRK